MPADLSHRRARPMPAVRRSDRRDEWWVDFRYKRRRIRRRSPIQTRRDAERYERDLLASFGEDENAGRDPFAGPPPTLVQFTKRWMTAYVVVQNRRSSACAKEQILRLHLLPALGDRRLDEIDTSAIDSLAAKLAKSHRPKTVNNILSVLRTALAQAQEWGLLRAVPKVRWLRVGQQPFRYLERHELDRLLAAAPPDRWREFLTVLAHTGLRFGELAALTWDDVVLTGAPRIQITKAASRQIIGPTKAGRSREVPLNAVAIQALAAVRHDASLVFPSPTGAPWSSSSTGKHLHRICREAGLKPFGWHTLRHTFATRLVQTGVSLPVVQKLLGHTTITMTARYTHVDTATMQSAVQMLTVCRSSDTLEGTIGHLMVTTPLATAPEPVLAAA